MNLKERLRKKLKKNGGFTLIEMLIVVAIIAILVVVSIPMVNASMEKAKKSTDDANERAAKAAAIAEFLMEDPLPTTAQVYYYNADTGEAVKKSGPAPTTSTAGYNYGQGTDGRIGYVMVTVDPNGTATPDWTTDGT